MGLPLYILRNKPFNRAYLFHYSIMKNSQDQRNRSSRTITRVLLVLVIAFFTSDAYGQIEILQKTTPEQRAAAVTDFLREKLTLTPSQTTRAEVINLNSARDAEAILKSSRNRFSVGREMRSLNQKRNQELKVILTDEQWDLFQRSRQEMKSNVLGMLETQLSQSEGSKPDAAK